jgi:hemoglobin/transferrin/lactoferrin receptor protein
MRPALLTLALVASSPAVFAQPNESPNPSAAAETIVVTATRTARDLDAVPATVSVMTSDEIERELARDVRDLIRYEPGVSVGGTGDRFGLGGFTIRGIGGNRVLTMIDGVRIADSYSFGPFLSASRDYVDVDVLKALEIVRGPGSALYGSDALGGVVAYRTKEARDYLDGSPFYAGFKTGYSSVDDSAVGTVTFAGGGDNVSGMVLYTRRNAHETETYDGAGDDDTIGIARQSPDPQDIESDNALLKLTLHPSDRHELTVGADLLETQTKSQVMSDYDALLGTVRTLTSDSDDLAERERFSVDYEFFADGAFLDRVVLRLYSQASEQRQNTSQERISVTNGAQTHRWRDSLFEQDIDGIAFQADTAFGGAAAHYLVFGTEYWTTDSASLRTGGSVNLATGAFTADALPTRDFPPTEVTQYGVYVQDEIALLNERLLLTPSVRLDSFDATAVGDPIYFAGNPGQPAPADFDDSEVSPRLGALYRFTGRYALYAQYSEGFKAPPYDDVNVGFTNLVGGYKSISNPNLESEHSRNTELGLRVSGDFGRLSVVAFRNTFEDFIESQLPAAQFAVTGGVDPADGLLTFQSRNLAGVEIEGLELSGQLELSEQFALQLALAYADGTDEATGQPVNSVDPLKGVFGLRYLAPSQRWGGDIVLTAVDAKDASDISGNRYATPGYGFVDVLAHFRTGERVQLNFGLFNIGDKRYVSWADTPGISFSTATGTYPELNRFTHPGFNAGINVRVSL